MGRALGQCADAQLDGPARVLYINQPPGGVGVTEFGAGLRRGMAATAPDSKIVAVTDNDIDRRTARQAALAAIRQDTTINAIVGVNDGAILGATDALEVSDRKPGATCVVGVGGGDESVAAVRAGKVYALAALQYQEDLMQGADQMLAMIAHPQGAGVQLVTPIKTIKD